MTKRAKKPRGAAASKAQRPRTKKLGRPLLLPPPNAAQRIEALAAKGHSVVGIARGLNTSNDTFRRWLAERPDLAEALARGREAEEFALHNVLFRAAMKGNIVAAIYLTKSKFGWRDQGDQGDAANKVSITFQLPGALKPEDFAKVIEHEPADTDKPVPATGITRS